MKRMILILSNVAALLIMQVDCHVWRIIASLSILAIAYGIYQANPPTIKDKEVNNG